MVVRIRGVLDAASFWCFAEWGYLSFLSPACTEICILGLYSLYLFPIVHTTKQLQPHAANWAAFLLI